MIGVIDYKAGNAPSVYNALKRIGGDGLMIHHAEEIKGCDGLILPGVGSAAATLSSLKEMKVLEALEESVLEGKIPFLGICIGMQILFDHSEEGDIDCLGWLKGNVTRFDAAKVRVPQMGWNKVSFKREHLLTQGITEEAYFYYVNSYHVNAAHSEDVLAVTDYNGEFCCMVQHENIMAAQFHIEKSGPLGLQLLKNYINLVEGGEALC